MTVSCAKLQQKPSVLVPLHTKILNEGVRTPVQQTNQRMKTTRAQPGPKWLNRYMFQRDDGMVNEVRCIPLYIRSCPWYTSSYMVENNGSLKILDVETRPTMVAPSSDSFGYPVEWFAAFRNMFPSLKSFRAKKLSSVGHIVYVNCKLTFKGLEWSFALPWCLPWDNALKTHRNKQKESSSLKCVSRGVVTSEFALASSFNDHSDILWLLHPKKNKRCGWLHSMYRFANFCTSTRWESRRNVQTSIVSIVNSHPA